MGKCVILNSGGESDLSNFAKLEYIESTGTQYINTKYYYNNSNNNGRLATKYIPVEVNSTYHSLRNGGSYSGEPNRALIFYGSSSDGRLGVGGGDVSLGYSFAANTLYEVDLTAAAGNITGIINGVSIGTKNYSGNNYSSQPYLLFCNNENGSPGNYGKIKLYYYKLYDNNKLVRDFIPVINIYSLEAGLYDKVEKKFYKNAGTGTFKYVFKNFNEASKVLDFNINYIQSHGQQHMSTGLTTKGKHWFDITMQFDVINDYMFTFGVWSNLSVGAKNNKLVIGGGATEMNLSSYTVTTGKTYNIISGQANTIVDGVSIQNATHDNTTGAELYLFSNNYIWDSTYGYSRSKIYGLKLYNGTFNDRNNSILERDYVPFKFKENPVCGLYDKVENKIYLNAGSGSFTYG